jgi:8-oxo-dGTP diphosphatase
MQDSVYGSPILIVDCVIFQLQQNQLHVLLIERTQEPFKSQWTLPGGHNPLGQTTLQAMFVAVQSKAGLRQRDFGLVQQLYTFDIAAKDPRGQAVNVSYMALGKNLTPHASETDQNPTFFPVIKLPRMAYGHKAIVRYALERLRSKLSYTNAVFALLPAQFTLSQLQIAYEAILERPLDKRNFRKKFLSLGLIEATTEMLREGAHRPAQLYRFRQQTLHTLTRSFD